MLTEPVSLSVHQSAKFIADNSKDVRVDPDRCSAVADMIYSKMKEKHYSTQTWAEHPLNPKDKSSATVDWIFAVDTLNFSFWSEKSDSARFTIEYKGQAYTGYWSLVAAINRALDNGIPITTPAFWGSDSFTIETLAQVFESSTSETIPLLRERFKVLKETAQSLKKLRCNSAADLIATANKSAIKFLDILTGNFASYRDVAQFHGREVFILKRAQILIGDLWACFNGKSFGEFSDIDKLTMFADYRVPQILFNLGCIQYSEQLEALIRGGHELENGSEQEIELRGCSIWAVELMAESIRQFSDGINSVLIDFYLWDTAKEQESEADIPPHRTRSIYY